MLLPASAAALPPANDAASQAIEVVPITAENGSTADRQGVADLGEATPDVGTPRCLGPASFQRTAWFRVPGGPLQTLRLDAAVSAGQPDEVAQLAVYVQPSNAAKPSTTEPQACDGPETGSTDAGVGLTVPAGHDVLVQVGLPQGSKASQVVLSVDADPLNPVEPPAGDDVSDRVQLVFAKARSISLRGATVGIGDPAQPACPAATTVWRTVKVKQSGTQVVAVRGRDVATLTAFVGKRPAGDGVTGCRSSTSEKTETLSLPFRAKRGDVAWLRVGANEPRPQSPRIAFSGPCDQTPLDPLTRPRVTVAAPTGQARRKREIRVRVTTDGPCLNAGRVTIKRGRAVVARSTFRRLSRGTRTLRVRREARRAAPRGRYRVSISGRTPTAKRKSFGVTKTVTLR